MIRFRSMGLSCLPRKESPVKQYVGQTFVIQFNDPLSLAKSYSAQINAATWLRWSIGGESGNHGSGSKEGNRFP